MPQCEDWAAFLTSPLILALAALIVVYARLKTAEINAQLQQLIQRNATKDAAEVAAVEAAAATTSKTEVHHA